MKNKKIIKKITIGTCIFLAVILMIGFLTGPAKLSFHGVVTDFLFAREKNYVIVTTDLTNTMLDEAQVSFHKIPPFGSTEDDAEWEPMEYWKENRCYHALLGRGVYRVRLRHPDIGSVYRIVNIDGKSDVYSLPLNYYFSGSAALDPSNGLLTAQGDYIPEKATVWNGHAYKVLYTEKKWTEANKLCIGLGGYLATITSQEEMDVIEEMVADLNHDYYWLGGYNEDGNWVWITGEDFEYQGWAEGQPDGPESGMAMQLMRNQGLDDTYNSGPQQYVRPWIICEWELADAAAEAAK